MPVTSFGGNGNDDWLQQLLAAQQSGALQQYAPGNGAAPPPTQAPPQQAAPWLQVPTLGPVFNASGSPGGPGPGPGGPGTAGYDAGFNNPYQAAATAPALAMMPPRTPTPDNRTYPSWPTPGPGGSSGTAATVANAPPGNPSATPRSARPVTPTPATAYPTRSAAAPTSNPRFGTVQYQVPNSSGGPLSRNPIYTSLNLFGGGQPAAAPAVNPNVPAANARPVSASAPNAYPGDAGWGVDAQGNPIPSYGDLQNWNYGPLQQGNIWKGSGGPRRRVGG